MVKLAHVNEFSASAQETAEGLEQVIARLSITSVFWASIAMVVLIFLAIFFKKHHLLGAWLFILIAGITIVTSLFLVTATVYLNQVSSSKGPVHWHADLEIWRCGQEIELVNPVGRFSNKVGTSTLHEHNDKRIHLEGVVVEPRDATLGKFFHVVEGEITPTSLKIPTPSGQAVLLSGSTCSPDSSLQVFAITTTPDKYYLVTKVTDPANYIISPQSQVPPADCIIVEIDNQPDTTDKLCQSYEVALEIGKLKGRANGN